MVGSPVCRSVMHGWGSFVVVCHLPGYYWSYMFPTSMTCLSLSLSRWVLFIVTGGVCNVITWRRASADDFSFQDCILVSFFFSCVVFLLSTSPSCGVRFRFACVVAWTDICFALGLRKDTLGGVKEEENEEGKEVFVVQREGERREGGRGFLS